MLAYLFWHRPVPEVAAEAYETRLADFHRALGIGSVSLRLGALPFAPGPGYEDWYPVDDWAALGALNHRAVSSTLRPAHDPVAALSAQGWGGVYRLLRGSAAVPTAARWVSRPPGGAAEGFVASLGGSAVWQRQLVLGPAPEFCVGGVGEARARVGG